MNWGELKDAVRNYTHRDDLDALFPVFLAGAEQRIYYGEANTPGLRLEAMRCTVSMATATRPDDYLEARAVYLTSDPRKRLSYVSPDWLSRSANGYSWDGQRLTLSPDQFEPVSLEYWAKFPTPKDDADTNWLMENAPGVYLSAMLVEVAKWARDDELGAREAANFSSAANALHSSDKAARVSGGPLNMRMRP